MSELAVATLSRDEARSLTDEVKQDAERLWRKLVELYEGGAHEVLGYSSWGVYFKAEFGGTKSQAYQLLSAGQVMETLDPVSDLRLPANHEQARELAPLLKKPETLREAWQEVVVNNPEPTAAQVREVVTKFKPDPKPGTVRQTQLANTAKERIERAVGTCNGLARGLDLLRVDLAADVTSADEFAGWLASFSDAIKALRGLQARIKEIA